EMAYDVNEQSEDIGARRLHTLLEKLLEEISFEAPEMAKAGNTDVVIDAEYVDKRLKDIAKNHDLSQFIL
ncbi:MAG: HslU--HslV peptidase ATPase subunit, partial [Selenomonadaceae bacterium]|nr:HslU--HslV peptidase ATPase subunit [Selenomonadaceae bacterium]